MEALWQTLFPPIRPRAVLVVHLPIIMYLVVETDGYLADGTKLVDGIDKIDGATEAVALFLLSIAFIRLISPERLATTPD
ncbi:hypothetical protein GS610_10135 [Ruegeria sp. HKCCD6228]|uniref:hypothetical protein n=1 Tax=unclassified Ruegeria TaxID=2625375 RepID=UPI001489BDC0|nr:MULTISPECIES: hypothetical protein [unclassified Ruegeria]NOC93831.1 hypothetical protein [Ruegeria sp. HKCCD6604]NOD97568.1 hypothetical protein [Ruegeria sp. HKCCD6228]